MNIQLDSNKSINKSVCSHRFPLQAASRADVKQTSQHRNTGRAGEHDNA